jgi:hypothetical protein
VINSNYITSYRRTLLDSKIQDIKGEDKLADMLKRVQENQSKEIKQNIQEVPKLLLDKFHKCTDSKECLAYLKQRKIEPQDTWLFSTEKFFEFNDDKLYVENFLIIPIFNDNDKFRGWYSRSIKEKQFSTFLLEDQPRFWQNDPHTIPEIVCEGVFDALSTGYNNCAALLGAELPLEYQQSFPKSTIFAFDNDPTGTEKSIKYTKMGFNIFVWPDGVYKDFNELLQAYSKKEINELIKANTFKGIGAETRLRMKAV